MRETEVGRYLQVAIALLVGEQLLDQVVAVDLPNSLPTAALSLFRERGRAGEFGIICTWEMQTSWRRVAFGRRGEGAGALKGQPLVVGLEWCGR